MVYFLVLLAVLLRVATHFHDYAPFAPLFQYLPHLPNFAPIAALALFGGTYLNKKYALVVPVVAMFIADYFIGFYNPLVMASVYGSFLIVALIGIWLRNNKTIQNVIGGCLTGSILFFVITNFSVWLAPQFYYQRTIQGLLECYTMALPFFRYTIAGDLFYVGAFFGLMELSAILVKKFSAKKASVRQFCNMNF